MLNLKVNPKFYFFISLFLIYTPSFGQAPEIEWQRCLGGKQYDWFSDAELLPDGSLVVLAGSTSCDGIIPNYKGDADVLIFKLNPNGNIEWIKSWGGSGKEEPLKLLSNPFGNQGFCMFTTTNSTNGDIKFKENNTNNIYVQTFTNSGKEDFLYNRFSGTLYFPNRNQSLICSSINENKTKISFVTYSGSGDGFLFNSGYSQIRTWEKVASRKPYTVSGGITVIPSPDNRLDAIPITGNFVFFKDVLNDKENNVFTIGESDTKDLAFFDSANAKKNKIKLANFHKSKGPLLTTDATIFKIDNDFKNIKALCLGGIYNERGLKIISTHDGLYHAIISSNSEDGDFKVNHGGEDIWVVEFDEKLKVKNTRNIGTKHNDKMQDAFSIGANSWACLMNSGEYRIPPDKVITIEEMKKQQEEKAKVQKKIPPTALLADNEAMGLKLEMFDGNKTKFRVNFDFIDDEAKMWDIGNNQIVITAKKNFNGDIDAVLICVDINQGKILWEKIIGGNQQDNITKVIPAPDGGLFAFGTTLNSDKSDNIPMSFGLNDIWVLKLNQKEKISGIQSDFKDNLASGNPTVGDNDSSVSITNLRLNSLVAYYKDTASLNELWTIAQTSEYLADFGLAATVYETIISILDKAKSKPLISKARAHQITCKFLMQSQKLEPEGRAEEPKDFSEALYGIGINTSIISNHLMVYNVIAGSPADSAGLKTCDEIVSINGDNLSNDCMTGIKVFERLTGKKDSYINISVKRFQNRKLLNFSIQRSLILVIRTKDGLVKSVQNTNNTEGKKKLITKKQEQKQNFLTKLITSLQKDSILMKKIEIARKVNYALSIINKWTNEPIKSKYLLQIDEQLGMLSSLINIIKGNRPNFSFDNNGKVSFGNPELKELISKDYVKEAQEKYDSIARKYEGRETKIDENITFVEKSKAPQISGYYKCIEMHAPYIPGIACPEPDVWTNQTRQGEGPAITWKGGLTKLTIKSEQIMLEGEGEIRIPANSSATSFGGVTTEIITNESNSKTRFVAIGKFSTLSTLFKLAMKSYTSNIGGGGKHIYDGKVIATYPSNNGERMSEDIVTLEILPNNRIKLSNANGAWTISQKIKDL